MKPAVQLDLVPRTETRHGFKQGFVELAGVLAFQQTDETGFVLDDASQASSRSSASRGSGW